MKIKNANKGFTLIELLVVVLIIGVLAAIALPQYRIATLKAKYARAKQTANDIRRAYELYYTVHNEFPTTFSQLDFANKFDNSNSMYTDNGYFCQLAPSYNEVYCSIDNNFSLRYFVKYRDNNKIQVSCRATNNSSDIYNRICQQETGKTAEEATCREAGYCEYNY